MRTFDMGTLMLASFAGYHQETFEVQHMIINFATSMNTFS